MFGGLQSPVPPRAPAVSPRLGPLEAGTVPEPIEAETIGPVPVPGTTETVLKREQARRKISKRGATLDFCVLCTLNLRQSAGAVTF